MPTSGRVIPEIQRGYIDGMGEPTGSWYKEVKMQLDDFNSNVKERVAKLYDQPFSAISKKLVEGNYWELQG